MEGEVELRCPRPLPRGAEVVAAPAEASIPLLPPKIRALLRAVASKQ